MQARKLREDLAVEAMQELQKIFNATQNYIKMIDVGIDEIEKEEDLAHACWFSDDSKMIYDDAHSKTRRSLNEYCQ